MKKYFLEGKLGPVNFLTNLPLRVQVLFGHGCGHKVSEDVRKLKYQIFEEFDKLFFFFQYSAIHVKKNLTKNLITKIKILKLLSLKSYSKRQKILGYERLRGKSGVTRSLLNYVDLSDDDYKKINPNGNVINDTDDSSKSNKRTVNRQTPKKETPPPSKGEDLVMSSRVKALEEVPSLEKEEEEEKEKPVVDYLGEDGEIAYAKLLKDEIEIADKKLVSDAKVAGQLGGQKIKHAQYRCTLFRSIIVLNIRQFQKFLV